MAFNKYLVDYKVVKEVDEKGKTRERVDYIGPVFVFRKDPEVVLRVAKQSMAFLVVMWIAVLGSMCIRTDFGHVALAILPMSLAIFPMYSMTRCLIAALHAGDILERQESDRLSGTYPTAATVTLGFLVIGLAGTILGALTGRGTLNAGGILFLAVQLIAAALGLLCYLRRGEFATREALKEKMTSQESEEQ